MEEQKHRCESFTPDHVVHHIQARLAREDTETPDLAGRLVEVDPDGTLVIDLGDRTVRLWNHDPSRLKRLVDQNAGLVRWRPRWGLLSTPSADGQYLFCVSQDLEHRTACEW